MSLPSTIQLPLHSDYIRSQNPEDMEKYMRELVFTLQTMYEDLADGINGQIRSDFQEQQQNWKPILKGTSADGTFTYTHQSGLVRKQGLLVDVWGDVQWSAQAGATGNLYVELPYIVANVNNMPLVGVVQPSSITFTGGTDLVINGIDDTYKGEFWYTGDGIATGNQAVVNSGRLIFHLRYLTKDDELA